MKKNNNFFVFLDETQYMQLIPYPLLDGTRDYTLPKGISYKCAISRKKNVINLRNYLFFHKKIFGIGEQLMKRAKKHICHPCKFMVKRDEKEKIEKPKCIYIWYLVFIQMT